MSNPMSLKTAATLALKLKTMSSVEIARSLQDIAQHYYTLGAQDGFVNALSSLAAGDIEMHVYDVPPDNQPTDADIPNPKDISYV